MDKKVLFEVCCGCLEDAVNAEKGGADRIELNSALFLGGLTPGVGLLKEVKKHINIPVMCMVRPREGGFCYSEYDYRTILAETEALIDAGADGIVFGFLTDNGEIDVKRSKELINLIKSKNEKAEIVFHRAIDLAPEVLKALKELIDLGVDRVLTSGQKASAFEGKETIRKMQELAGDKIEILPGGGINAQNAKELIEYTGVKMVHASARSERLDKSGLLNPEIFFGGKIDGKWNSEHIYKVTDEKLVKNVVDAIQ